MWLIELRAVSSYGHAAASEDLGRVEVEVYGDHIDVGRSRMEGKKLDRSRWSLTTKVIRPGTTASEGELMERIAAFQKKAH